MIQFFLTATRPDTAATVIDPEKATVPYLLGAAPFNAPSPIKADHYAADGSIVHDTAGEYIHPSVLDFKALTASGLFAGHRYWMANSEYSTVGGENTMILCSDDAYTWRQPAGAKPGVIFRVEDQGTPPRGAINTDNELVWDSGSGRLCVIWREDSSRKLYWYSDSADGVSWTAPVVISEGAGKGDPVSPTVVPDGAGGWIMHNWSAGAVRRTAPALTGPWTDPTPTQGANPWHAGAWRDPSTGVIYVIGGNSKAQDSTSFVAFRSEDQGVTFRQTGTVLRARSGSWDDTGKLYRPTLQPHPDGKHFRFWYSVHTNNEMPHRTGYTLAPRTLWGD